MSQTQILSSNLKPEKREKMFMSTSSENEPLNVRYRETRVISPETHMCLNHALYCSNLRVLFTFSSFNPYLL